MRPAAYIRESGQDATRVACTGLLRITDFMGRDRDYSLIPVGRPGAGKRHHVPVSFGAAAVAGV